MFIKLPIKNIELNESSLKINKDVFKFKELTEESKEIVNTLINKGAYATTLLYLNNNSILESYNDKKISNQMFVTYLTECKNLLKECVKETSARKFKPLAQVGKLEIMESGEYIARGKGDKILIEDFRGYDYWGPKDGAPIEGECIIQYYDGPGNLQYLCKARNGRFVWRDSSRQDSEPYVFPNYNEALRIVNEMGGEILDYHKEYLGESVQADGTTRAYEIVQEFEQSERTKENFNNALNEISKMEYENMINKDIYDECIKKIQDLYVNRDKKLSEECEGTQCSDIAEKKDQEVGGKMIQPKRKKKIKESYNILTKIEDALEDAGLKIKTFKDSHLLTKDFGWVVTDGESEVQLTCSGLTESATPIKNKPTKKFGRLREADEYEEYMNQEKKSQEEGLKKELANITDEHRRKFNAIKEVINDEAKDELIDGFAFPHRALLMIQGASQYYMNQNYDLTNANVLCDIDEFDSVEDVIKNYFNEYKAYYAESWAENFLDRLDKADVDSDFAIYYEQVSYDVPKNHKFKGFMMQESGHYERGNYVLINENGTVKAVNKKSLKEDFWNPGKYMKLFMDEYNNVDLSDWNGASQSKRNEMVKGVVEDFWNKYGEKMKKSGLKAFLDDLEDSNYHTELNLFLDLIKGPRTYTVSKHNKVDGKYKEEVIEEFDNIDEAEAKAQEYNKNKDGNYYFVSWYRK